MPFKSTKTNDNKEEKLETIEEDNNDTNEEELNETDEINETVVNEEIKQEISKEIKTKKDNKIKKYKTENGEQIIVKKKPKKKKPLVVYMSESESDEEQKVIVKPKPKRGRPKNSSKKAVVEYVDKDGNKTDNRNKSKKTIINHPVDKPLTASEIKLIELEQKLAELEAVSGKKILSTKKGKIDKRQTKAPTEKQIAQRKKFVEDNKLRALKRKEEKEAKKKEQSKEDVKAVVDELTKMKKEKMKQIEIDKKEEIKEQPKLMVDDYFN